MASNTHKTDPYRLSNLPVEMWGIDRIKPYARNTKVHSQAHITKLKASIAADGLFDPLIVDQDGEIIAGHGRYQALTDLGHTKVPVRHAAHLSKSQAAAARISHNKTASTEYDSGFMAEEMQMLMEADDVDMAALGFDEHELDFLVDDLGEMNMGAISEDLDEDIDNQDRETREKVAATDASSERVTKAFGFAEIPIAAVKHVRRLMAEIEEETGMKGAEAFSNWVAARV